MTRLVLTVIAGLLAAPAFAESHASGDAAAGEKAFNKCKSCHAVTADDGTDIVKGGKVGPNLYGLAGRAAGSVEGYKYGEDLVAAGAAGLVWDEASFVEYSADPRAFLRAYLDNDKAKSKMAFKLNKGAEDIYAYLVSVGPQS